jgi:argininosuccinate lyase
LVAQADQHKTTLAPGFTHLQPAQPIVFGHQLLAHAQALSRDVDRLHRLGPAQRALTAGCGGTRRLGDRDAPGDGRRSWAT